MQWLQATDPQSLLLGLVAGLLAAALAAWLAWRAGSQGARGQLQDERAARVEAEQRLAETAADSLRYTEELSTLRATGSAMEKQVQELRGERDQAREEWRASEQRLARQQQDGAKLETRLQEQAERYENQLQQLQAAEQRLGESFERLAGKIFEERSQNLRKQNNQQLDEVLKPLRENLNEFQKTVSQTHKEELAQNRVLQEKLKDLEQLNVRLHDDATNLTRALVGQSKVQGNWGEQQLERLLELSGLTRGQEYSVQYPVTSAGGTQMFADLVLHLPGQKSIVLDSKVSLTDWVRYQAAEDDTQREAAMKAHVASVRKHIRELGEKRYSEVPELHALDFVLMFMPIESALIEALQADPKLAEYALGYRVALLSPTNFLATMRTVASIWLIDKQNTNAREMGKRAGLLYDKFVGFVDNLQKVGKQLDTARNTWSEALGQLSTGQGNLVRQAEILKQLGARHSKQLEEQLLEQAGASADNTAALENPAADSTVEDQPADVSADDANEAASDSEQEAEASRDGAPDRLH